MSKKDGHNYYSVEFYCTHCGNKGIPLMRSETRTRQQGHLKKLYCIHCKAETNHVEILPFGKYDLDTFKQELVLGRFVNGDRIDLDNLYKCSDKNCKFNIEGKCWNCSINCNNKPLPYKRAIKEV